jgi:hypothetical protein
LCRRSGREAATETRVASTLVERREATANYRRARGEKLHAERTVDEVDCTRFVGARTVVVGRNDLSGEGSREGNGFGVRNGPRSRDRREEQKHVILSEAKDLLSDRRESRTNDPSLPVSAPSRRSSIR